MNFLIVFVLLSIINVVFSTVRSLTTIKSGKWVASIISGGYFAFYNIMLVWTVADFPMWQKCLVTFGCNVIGVFVVKWFEEKLRKGKLWKIDCTVYSVERENVEKALKVNDIPYCYNENGKHTMFTIFCATKDESAKVAEIVQKYHGKYFVSENCGTLI